MIFLKDTDFPLQVRESILNEATRANLDIIDDAEAKAIETFREWLACTKYDLDAIFSVDNDRHPLIIMYLVDIMLYHIHSSGINIPETKLLRYDSAMTWLKHVKSGMVAPNKLPLLPEPAPTNAGQTWSARPKRNNRF